MKGPTTAVKDQTDGAVARFTRELLGIARKNDVPFETIGRRETKTDEVLAVLRDNYKVAERLMTKQEN